MKTKHLPLTIASGAAVSAAFDLSGWNVIGVITPAAWTAGDISFEVEEPAGTYVKVVDNEGVLFKLTGIATNASELHLMGGGAFDGTAGLSQGPVITAHGNARVVSTNTASEADVNQGAARTVVVILASS